MRSEPTTRSPDAAAVEPQSCDFDRLVKFAGIVIPRSDLTAPAVSAVVASRNEEQYIEVCVRSLLAQHEPEGGFEVIIADGMSDDRTREILTRLAQEDQRLIVIDNPQRITPAGFNAGIRKARGRFIAMMGAHARYAPDYLVQCLELAERLGTDNVGGPAIAEAHGYLQRAIAASHHSPFSVGGASWHSLEFEGKADTVFGGFYRRDVFDRVGLYDENLIRNNDNELNFRLRLAGGKIWQSPAIRAWYAPRSTLGQLFRQYQQFGYFKVRVLVKHGRVPAVRQYVPAALVLGLTIPALVAVIAGLLSLAWPGSALWVVAAASAYLFGAVAISYLAVLVIASVTTAARFGWDLLPILPPTFATYHLSNGIGFLQGLFDFVLRRRSAHAARMSQLSR
jgi:succinoglycan biosynthesis protein ExoA